MSHSLAPVVQFTGGEWSPSMDNRFDLEGYRNAMRQGRNVIVTKQGGAARRPGTQFIVTGKVAASGANSISSLRKFQFAPGTTFQLEFCDHGIRFYSNGVQVVLAVSGLTTWTTGNSWPAGSFVTDGTYGYYLYSGSSGLGTALINSTTTPGSDTAHWTNNLPASGNANYIIYEVPAPYSGTGATAIGGGSVTAFTPPNYWTADVCNVQILAINDVVYIVHPNFPVWKLTRYTNTNWVMQQVQFLAPPMMDENATDMTLAANATTGTGVTVTAAAGAAWAGSVYYVPGNTVSQGGLIYACAQAHTSGTFSKDLANGLWTLQTVFVAGHVNSYWQLAYNRPSSFVQYNLTGNTVDYSNQLYLVGTWEVQTYGTWQGDIAIVVSYDNQTSWQVITTLTSVGDANFSITGQELNGGIYALVVTNWASQTSSTPPRVVLTADNQFVYGLVQITAVGGGYSATASVIQPLYTTGKTQFWSEGAWSTYRGYPQALTVFQERVWYGYTSAEPQRIWATQTDDIENFALVDQSQATYGLAFDLNAPGRGPIQWLAAQTDLFVGLAGAEWIITSGSTTSAITATAIQALEHTVNGSAPSLPGIVVGQACIYAQRKARTFQQMLFSVFTNKYMSTDLQASSQHLTRAGIVQFDYQQQFQNQSLLWAVMGDGTLASMTYSLDQKVFAWTRHDTGTDTSDVVISVSVIEGAAGQDDEVWATILRNPLTATGCQIERIYPVDWQTYNVGLPQLNQAVYADCATILTGGSVGATMGNLPACLSGRPAVVAIIPSSNTGMWAIRGLTFQNSIPLGVYVTIPNYVPAAGDVAVIGLPINWAVQPMRLDLDPRAGPTPGLTKSVRKLVLRVLNSLGGQWSTVAAPPVAGSLSTVTDIRWYPITQNSGNPPPFTANVPLDLDIDVGGLFGYSLDPQFAIQGYDPLPFYLLGISVQYDIGGRE